MRIENSFRRWAQWGAAGLLLACLGVARLHAAPVAVHHPEGTLHGYLVMRDQNGQILAVGDQIVEVRGSRVTMHTIFHFKDGSLDDETSVFAQRRHFRLISDHHVQKGPFFAHPMDMWIDAAKGMVTVRSWDKDGKESLHKQHMNLPPDLCSPAMLVPIAMNLSPGTGAAEVSMVAATPKPLLVKLDFSARGEDSFRLAGFARKAEHYEVHIKLQGLAGIVAPLIGKEPPNVEIWIEEGAVPAFVKEESPLAEGGPVVSIQQIGPVGPKDDTGGKGK